MLICQRVETAFRVSPTFFEKMPKSLVRNAREKNMQTAKQSTFLIVVCTACYTLFLRKTCRSAISLPLSVLGLVERTTFHMFPLPRILRVASTYPCDIAAPHIPPIPVLEALLLTSCCQWLRRASSMLSSFGSSFRFSFSNAESLFSSGKSNNGVPNFVLATLSTNVNYIRYNGGHAPRLIAMNAYTSVRPRVEVFSR